MEQLITTLIIFYLMGMLGVGFITYKRNSNLDEINLGGRKMNWLQTSFSIAATWIWAPALFVASERAYVNGLLGLFWFTVPNVLTLILFAFISRNALARLKKEHTLADLMGSTYKSKRMKNLYTFELLTLSIFSTAVQLLAGGRFLNILTGINFGVLTAFLASVALVYSALSGLKASVKTDVIQMVIMIIAVVGTVFYLAPRASLQLGGRDNLDIGLFTAQNWQFFLAFGFTTSIGLLAGPIGDQTFWQRAFSMQRKNVFKSFALAALIFAVVPVGTGLIGFYAAGEGFEIANTGMVGLEFILSQAPTAIVALFALAIISGLASTLDSNMVAVGSLVSKMHPSLESVKYARYGMIAVALFGIIVANIPGVEIFWLFLFYGVLRATVAVPTIFTMLTERLPDERFIFYGTLGAMVFGIPVYAIGAIAGIQWLALTGTLSAIIIPTIVLTYERLLK